MTTHTEFLKFSDKIYFNSTHYQGSLSLNYIGSQSVPVVEQQKTDIARNFERCIYQVHQIRNQDQQAFLWGEAAETAKYVSYGQVIKLWNVFSNKYLTCEGVNPNDSSDDTRQVASMTMGTDQHLPAGHPDEKNHERQCFKILPKYKIREIGERVRIEDQIVVASCETDLYLHVTSDTASLSTTLWKSHQEQVMESKNVMTPIHHFVDFQSREQKGAVWQMEAYETDKDRERKDATDACVMAGSAVVLYHREAEGFVLCDWQIQDAEHVYIDQHTIQKATFNVLDLPYSSNALWTLEAENPKQGGAVLYSKHRKLFRLKHMATEQYLTLNVWDSPVDGTRMQDVTMTYTPEDKNTLLSIHPLDSHDGADALTITSFARFCFHYEEVWLHAAGDYTVDEPVKTTVSDTDQFKAASLGTTGKLQRVETTTKGYYEDVFAVRVVRSSEKESLTQVCNMVVALERFNQYWIDIKHEREEERRVIQEQRNLQMQRGSSTQHSRPKTSTNVDIGKNQADSVIMQLSKDKKHAESGKLIRSVIKVFTGLVLFCTKSKPMDDPFAHNGPPLKKHQRILFQQNVHNLVFRILKAPLEYGGISLEAILRLDQFRNMRSIYALGYRLVKQMVRGSKDMAQQMSQFLPFIETQLGDMTSIADAYMQIICDNDRLLEQLQNLQLESFLWLVPQHGRKATYMTLLSACCICDNEGIPRNQRILIKKLRNLEKLKLIYATKSSGDAILVKPVTGFPGNVERKIRRFKRRKENGVEEDDESTDSESESDDDVRGKVGSPYSMRYSPRSRSASPQAALLSVARNIPGIMSGTWVWYCDIPCVIPRWQRSWLRVQGGSLLLAKSASDVHPRSVPMYMFHQAKKDSLSGRSPPEGLSKHGMQLIYKAPKNLIHDEENRNEQKLLICAECSRDRVDLLTGFRREIKHSASVDNNEFDLPGDLVSSSSASLTHYHAQLKTLMLRHTTGFDPKEIEDDEANDDSGWITLEEWIQTSDIEEVRYFEQCLRFMASLCVGGTDTAINYVKKRYSHELILAGMTMQIQHQLCDPIRSAFVRLARHLYVENGLHEFTPPEILDRLKDTVYDFITRNSRQEASATARNMLMTEMLELANVIVTAGCYTCEELEHLFHPLLRLLDGTSDSGMSDEYLISGAGAATSVDPYRSDQNPNQQTTTTTTNSLLEPGSPRDPGSPRTQESRRAHIWSDSTPGMLHKVQRYHWSERMQLVMESKLACCKLLWWLFANAGVRSEINIKKWVSRVSSTDRRLGNHPEGAFLKLKSDLLTQILLDITLYRGYPLLYRTALQLVLVNISGVYGDPEERDIEDDDNAINGLAEVLKADLLNRNQAMTVNLFRHFTESREDSLTIALMRVFKTIIGLHPSKKEKEKMQSLLDDLGVTPIVTQMIESKDEHVVSEALQFGHALLEGGNNKVQVSILNYFLSLNDEAFFSCTKDRIVKAVNLMKSNEVAEKHKSKKVASHALHNTDSTGFTPSITVNTDDDRNSKYKQCELYHLDKVLRFLQLFCEGHNRDLQNYLRVQDDNVHTYNLVKETITVLKTLLMVEQCDEFIFDHIVQAFNTLTEYCQGPCYDNQHSLVNANIAFEVNVVLARPLPLVDEQQTDELKNAALTMLLSVLEGVEEQWIPAVISTTLDLKLIKALLTDIWSRRKEPEALDLGFTAFMLLKTLSAFDDSLSEFIERCEGFSFYTALTGRIEILRSQSLVRVYFRIPFICSNLSDKTKDELLWNVNRETPTARITDFYDRAEELIYEIEFYERNFKQVCEPTPGAWIPSRNERVRQCKYLINSTINWWENAMIVLAFLINGIVCMNYVTNTSVDIVRAPLEGFHIESEIVLFVLNALIAVQFFVCLFLLFDFWVAKAPLNAHRTWKKERQLMMKRRRKKFSLKRYIEMFAVDHPELDRRQGPLNETTGTVRGNNKEKAFDILKEKFADRSGTPAGIGGSFGAVASSVASADINNDRDDLGLFPIEPEHLDDPERGLLTFNYSWQYTVKSVRYDTHFIFLTASVIFSLAGLFISPFFIALHLVSIINRSALLQNVIKAVTKNGRSLLLTVLLGIIIIYLFSVIGFVLFRDSFKNREPPCEGEPNCEDYHCDTLFRCFIFAVSAGIRAGGGIGDLMQPLDWESPYAAARTIFDFTFFVVVIVILLNIIFGVIIDTFAELRSEKQKVEEDIRSRCFICGIESSQFDRQADGFEHHIKNDHNMWNYIFFIHHLQKKDPDEFTGQESYVHSMMRKSDLSFFPLNKAVCLEGKQEEDDQVKELSEVHSATQKRVENVENQVSSFQNQFTKENQDLRDYLQGVSVKVIEATSKRHAILGGLYAAIQKDHQANQDGLKMRPLTPVG